MEWVTASGVDVPALGLGTYGLRGQSCTDTVLDALDMGYRHLDTAELYENQRAIGAALDRTPIDREELFLTTKLWKSNLQYGDAMASARESADKLGVDRLDLLLIHAPNPSVPLDATIQALNDLQRDGLVDHIGVSNFSVAQLEDARQLSATPIITNQVEYHPYEEQQNLLEYCIANEIALTAYSPLARGRVTDEQVLTEIGTKYGKSAAQVALRWLLQQPQVLAIPKAASQDHLRQNLAIFDFSLTDAEMERIFELGNGLVETLRRLLGL